jgi:hypothetical protein
LAKAKARLQTQFPARTNTSQNQGLFGDVAHIVHAVLESSATIHANVVKKLT